MLAMLSRVISYCLAALHFNGVMKKKIGIIYFPSEHFTFAKEKIASNHFWTCAENIFLNSSPEFFQHSIFFRDLVFSAAFHFPRFFIFFVIFNIFRDFSIFSQFSKKIEISQFSLWNSHFTPKKKKKNRRRTRWSTVRGFQFSAAGRCVCFRSGNHSK